LTRILRGERIRRLGPSLISLDSNPVPVGLYRTFTAGAAIAAGQVVSLHSDGKVYPASPSYPNVVGVAIDSAPAGGSVRVIVLGVAQVVADEAVEPGLPVTFSPTTPGRVVAYTGHSHGVSLTTGTALTDVEASTTSVVADVSVSTGSFLTTISVDRRNFTTATVLSDVTPSTGSFVTGVGTDTEYTTDSAGYIRHTHSTTTASAVTGVTKSTATVVTGITTTAGTTVVANVIALTSSAVKVVSTTPATVVSSISKSTGTFVTGVSVYASLSRVVGVALTSAAGAGDVVLVLVTPSRI
jgi:hypothetical protein